MSYSLGCSKWRNYLIYLGVCGCYINQHKQASKSSYRGSFGHTAHCFKLTGLLGCPWNSICWHSVHPKLMKSPVQWPKLPFWVGLKGPPWGRRKAIRTHSRCPGITEWCQLNKMHWPQRRGRGATAKASPIGGDQLSPQSVKEIGSRSCFRSRCHKQKETLFAHFFPSRFQPPATWRVPLIN